MLASWWEQAPCAWYTADQHDIDLPTLGRQLGDALRLRVPDIPSDMSWLAEGAGGPELEQFLRADALAAQLAEMLHEQLTTDLMLVIDDAHELAPSSPSARLVEALCRHAPPRLHVVISGRRQPPFQIERLARAGATSRDRWRATRLQRGRGRRVDRTADSVAAMRTSPSAIHRIAGGWPAAVTLAIEALKASPPDEWRTVFAGLDKPDAPLYSYLAEEVFARQPDAVRDLVGKLAVFDRFTPELCEAVGLAGSRATLGELTRQGLFVEKEQDGSLALRPLIREYALGVAPCHRIGRATSSRDSGSVACEQWREQPRQCRCCCRRAPWTISRSCSMRTARHCSRPGRSQPCCARAAQSRRHCAAPASSNSRVKRSRSRATGARRCSAFSALRPAVSHCPRRWRGGSG